MDNRCSASSAREVIAVVGKGGTGKTTVTAIIAKILSGRGYDLLAVDADPAVGLTFALGAKPEKTIGGLRRKLIEDPEEKRRIADQRIVNVIEHELLVRIKGISLLIMGRPEGPGCFCTINELLKFGTKSLSKKYPITLIDCEAGIEQINRRVIDHISTMLIISDATVKGIQTAGHLNEIAKDYGIKGGFRGGVIVNRVKADVFHLEEKARTMGLSVLGVVPEDENIASYDLAGRPTIELPSNSQSVLAVERVLKTLCILITGSKGSIRISSN